MSGWANLGHLIVQQAQTFGGDEEGALIVAIAALIYWCDEQGYSFPDAAAKAGLLFNQKILDMMVEDGKIVLGGDGKYRTPEHHAAHLRLVSSND